MNFMGLCESERAWLGSSQFYHALGKLGIDYRLYELPTPYVVSAEELVYYVDSILNDIRGCEPSEYVEYIKLRCKSLKRWADKGYIVHVLP